MPVRRSAMLGGTVGAALALAACGGGSSSSGGGGTPAAYVARADAVCARFKPSSNREADIAARRRIYAQVAAIDPPDALRAKVDAFLAASKAYLVQLGRRSSRAQDVRTAQTGAARGKLAAEIGYKRCGQPVGGTPLTTAGFLPASVAVDADTDCKGATD